MTNGRRFRRSTGKQYSQPRGDYAGGKSAVARSEVLIARIARLSRVVTLLTAVPLRHATFGWRRIAQNVLSPPERSFGIENFAARCQFEKRLRGDSDRVSVARCCVLCFWSPVFDVSLRQAPAGARSCLLAMSSGTVCPSARIVVALRTVITTAHDTECGVYGIVGRQVFRKVAMRLEDHQCGSDCFFAKFLACSRGCGMVVFSSFDFIWSVSLRGAT